MNKEILHLKTWVLQERQRKCYMMIIKLLLTLNGNLILKYKNWLQNIIMIQNRSKGAKPKKNPTLSNEPRSWTHSTDAVLLENQQHCVWRTNRQQWTNSRSFLRLLKPQVTNLACTRIWLVPTLSYWEQSILFWIGSRLLSTRYVKIYNTFSQHPKALSNQTWWPTACTKDTNRLLYPFTRNWTTFKE